MNNKKYWDRLQNLIDHAKKLQASPIPDDGFDQRINLMRLGYAEYELQQMLSTLPFINTSESS